MIKYVIKLFIYLVMYLSSLTFFIIITKITSRITYIEIIKITILKFSVKSIYESFSVLCH